MSLDSKVVLKENNRVIYIPFDKILQSETLGTTMNEFPINKKRNFIPLGKDISKILNQVFKIDKEIALVYLEFKTKMFNKYRNKKVYGIDEFIEDILVVASNVDLLKIISDYVDSSYKINLDQVSKKNKVSVNKELQFTDKHAKIILKTSMLMKYTIPLLMQYVILFNIKSIDSLLYDVFSKYFEYFITDNTNILNKIFKLIESRIMSTNYSDRVIWLYLQNIGMTSDTLARLLNKKIISNIIPKIENNTNVISFLHVVIKNSIKYQFTFKFPVSYKPLNLNSSDSEGLTDFDKLEINMVRSDESLNIIYALTIDNIIDSFKKKFKIEVSTEELEYYQKNVKINNIQTNYLFLFFSKYTKNYRILYNCNFEKYVHLLVIFEKWLRLNNLNIIADYVVSIPEKANENTPSNKKQVLNKIINFTKYDHILNRKYYLVEDVLVEKGLIIKLIVNLKYNKFKKLHTFQNSLKEPQSIDPEVINPPDELLINEVLNFIESV